MPHKLMYLQNYLSVEEAIEIEKLRDLYEVEVHVSHYYLYMYIIISLRVIIFSSHCSLGADEGEKIQPQVIDLTSSPGAGDDLDQESR